MKSIGRCIFEASGRPSDLKKYTRKERKENVQFIGGDIYDFKDPGYNDEFTYFDGSGNGYIKDKDGHVYDVITSERNGDAGRIAGGSHSFYVIIKKANGRDDFQVQGYVALFSTPRNADCIEDIRRGYYLEDYIAKYWNQYDDPDNKFKELAQRGDKNAKPYNMEKAEKLQNRKVEFDTRYISIPETLSWEITDGKFNIRFWKLTNASIESMNKKREEWLSSHYLHSWDDEAKNNSEYKNISDEISTAQEKLKSIIIEVLQPVLINRLQEVFKTKDLNSLSGLIGSFGYKRSISKGKNFGYVSLAIDTKKKVFCIKDEANYKIVDGNIELALDDNITIAKGKASEKMIELFKKVSDAWKKSEGRRQTEYVANHWKTIYDQSAYGWGNHSKTKGQAKEEAKSAFEKMVRDHNFDDPYGNNKLFTYSLALVQVYVEGDMEPDAAPVEKPLENPEPQSTKKPMKADKTAYDKMKAWHEGTRKQNLKNCSDEKLKMNYGICKELGYDNEVSQIEAEAKSRNLKL